jgi:tetratricopeptide (TPR) repeat protein
MNDDLLGLALRDPERAWALAHDVLRSSSEHRRRARAEQAIGVILREDGSPEAALEHLDIALRHALDADDLGLAADVRATRGITLILAGRTARGLRELDRASGESRGPARATILLRRGTVLVSLGRPAEALDDLQLAVEEIRNGGDHAWLARAWNSLGCAQLAVGSLVPAERSFKEAAAIYKSDDAAMEGLHVHRNLAAIAFIRGDLPRALDLYGRIDEGLARSGRVTYNLACSRAEVYLAAGLVPEAAEALERVPAWRLPETESADLLLKVANVRLAQGDASAALDAATSARRAFRRLDSGWYELRAQLAQVQARALAGSGRRLARDSKTVAAALHADRADEAPTALILAGDRAQDPERAALYSQAATYRTAPNALVRATGWLGHALATAAGDRAALLRSCARGLDAVDEYRLTMGSAELRALATEHGRRLAALAIHHAAHEPRVLLRWSERWRATALARASVTSDQDISTSLAMLRENARQLSEARSAGDPTETLERERRRLERAVRAEHHRQGGRFDHAGDRFEVGRLVDEIGDEGFVELVDVDGVLHVLVVSRGRVRRRLAGTVAEALELAERGRFALRRAARGGSFDPGDLGQRLQDVLLGDAVKLIPDGPVVIAPTVRLHGAPWALLPCLADRPFNLVPSAAQWLRAGEVKPPRSKTLHLIAGPGLGTGGAEVTRLKRRHPDATLLRGKKTTVEAALDALDGARLVHVAAHGHFRADSPLFSSLEMADGPLTVYELERLRRAPYRLVLSACESGVLAPVGAEELLGLAAALFSLGSAGLVCSIAEVNDDVTARLMVQLHDELAAGADPATALHAVRRAAGGDPLAAATAAAFVALGR